jgi:biopolymer transport protein ExbB
VDQVAGKVVADYTVRVAEATRELEETHARITVEKTPMIVRLKALESSIGALQSEIASLEESQAKADERSQQLQRAGQTLTKNVSYIQNLAHELVRTLKTGFLPGEDSSRLAALQQELESRDETSMEPATKVFQMALGRLNAQLGGHAQPGKAIEPDTNRVVDGTFGFLGPSAVFVAREGTLAGTAIVRNGAPFPTVYSLPNWTAEDTRPLAGGQEAVALLDPTAGKALSLQQTTGTYWEHVERGGVMAFVIIGVGLVAAILALHKLWEVRTLELDSPERVSASLASLTFASKEEVSIEAAKLRGATRALFLAGARHITQTKEVIEEQLYAFVLAQRLHYEKRLPLLGVIATAAPLMGLLGTVMGMVKTFALITVFGTGNAAKLSSGISEILVTTELGLVVAIPALVLHGFLTHRIQKKLSQLERHAIEFLAAATQAKSRSKLVGEVAP